MWIKLRTRCGCERLLDLEFTKPPPVVNKGRFLVPITSNVSIVYGRNPGTFPPAHTAHKVREFRFDGWTQDTDTGIYYIYEEVVE